MIFCGLTTQKRRIMMNTVTQHFRTDYEKFKSYLIDMTDWSVIFNKGKWKSTTMITNDKGDNNNIITITTEERVEINMQYLAWLYAKSREKKKKQDKGLLLNTRHAIELVMRDAGGEKALKELFLKEQDEKIIDELSKLNPIRAKTLKHDREAGLQVLNRFIADLEK